MTNSAEPRFVSSSERTEELVKKCRSAKKVLTKNGSAILIDNQVIEINGNDHLWTEVILKALTSSRAEEAKP